MAYKITPRMEVDGGDTDREVLYLIAKTLFGADANGVVTVPDDLTAAPVSFTNTSVVAEINAKT